MAQLDSFSAQIVRYVRSMSDEELLELVKRQLGAAYLGAGGLSSVGRAAPARHSAPGRRPVGRPPKTGRPVGRPPGKGGRKRGRPAVAAPTISLGLPSAVPSPAGRPAKAVAKRKPGRPRKTRQRATSAERGELLNTVEKTVKGSKGMSASEIAKKIKLPQARVANALRELKGSKKIFQGGERRFARYAGDSKTAAAASERARKNASGPKR